MLSYFKPKSHLKLKTSPIYFLYFKRLKCFFILFSNLNNSHTMKCTNIKCMTLNLYICIHLCNLHATQDTECKVRNIKEKKKTWSLVMSLKTLKASLQSLPWAIILHVHCDLSARTKFIESLILHTTTCIVYFKKTFFKKWRRLILNFYFQKLAKQKEDKITEIKKRWYSKNPMLTAM